MNEPARTVPPDAPPPRPRVPGFTLLEVLISMGVIIMALAGIAALLPAVGSRLGEATDTDRAGTLAVNARADLANRGLCTALLWTGTTLPVNTPPPGNRLAVVFGESLPALATIQSATASIAAAVPGEVAARVDTTDGFLLRDALQVTTGGTVTGFNRGICYGCMLSCIVPPPPPQPLPQPPRPPSPPAQGDVARLTTVVFRRSAADVKEFGLIQTGSNSPVFTSGSGADAAADRKRFLSGCAWVLVVSGSTPPACEPRWYQVASSWTAFPAVGSGVVMTSATGQSFVSLTGTDWVRLLSSGSLRAYGFDGLLRVDERFVTLDP